MKPIKSAVMAPSTPSSAKKNKRKSLEPKRLAASDLVTPETDRKRVRLNSTGSEDRSPPTSYNSESRSPSPSSPDSKSSEASSSPNTKRTSLSPMCLAPKKRFKFDALRDIEQLKSEQQSAAAAADKVKAEPEDKDSTSETDKSPFRPWSRSSSAAPVDTKPLVTSPAPGLGAIPAPYIPFLLGPGLKGVPGVPGAPHPLQTLLAGGLDPRLLSHYLPPYLPQQPPAAASTPPPQDEPLSLVVKKEVKTEVPAPATARPSPVKAAKAALPAPAFNVEALIQAQKALGRALPLSPAMTQPQRENRARHDSGGTEVSEEMGECDRAKQRNYKNMTRERRVEANARERQRVHTITAAFDSLQAAIPTDEKDCKLSKLSVIKIATAYIMALSRMAGHDYTEDQSAPPVEEVISHCSEVIEKECRIKKRNGSP